MGVFILFLHVLGWGVLAGFVAPQECGLGATGVFGLGLGLTASQQPRLDEPDPGPLDQGSSQAWHMYLVGLLFGLGFDTATELGLLILAAGAAAFALPWYAIPVLPVLLAAGMSLLDTIEGVFMNYAYGWAFSRPVRKVYYNITITGLSAGTSARSRKSGRRD